MPDVFATRASQILEAAESAASQGQPCSDLTIVLGHDGSLRMMAENDWPLDSLVGHLGANSAYRVSQIRGNIQVEGRDGTRHCRLQAVSAAETARRMLAAR